jgi:hypothetical protein
MWRRCASAGSSMDGLLANEMERDERFGRELKDWERMPGSQTSGA